MTTHDDDDDEALLAVDPPDLGPCCCCGVVGRVVRNVMMLDRRGPVPGTGWGCLQCGLPQDGAMYVACDACVEAGKPPASVVSGWVSGHGRAPIETLTFEAFYHDLDQHPELTTSNQRGPHSGPYGADGGPR